MRLVSGYSPAVNGYVLPMACEMGLVLWGNFLVSRDRAYGFLIFAAGLFVVPIFEWQRS
jgi:hypothetical protein